MSEPVQRGGHWWTQAEDGSWLRWNVDAYRWDPQPGPPPPDAPGESAAEVPAAPAAAGPGATSPVDAATTTPDQPPADAPGAATAAMRDFEPADGKGRVALVLLGLCVAGSAVRVPMMFDRASDRANLATTNHLLVGLTTFSNLAVLGAVIAVIVWFKAAYDNLEPLGATGLRYSPGWTIGGWFIPIANLVIPKQLANDLWRASDPKLPVEQGRRWKYESVAPVVHVWWIAWLARSATSVGAGAAERVAIRNVDISGVQGAVRVAAISELLMVVAGIALIVVIRGVTARQSERAALIAASSPERARALGMLGQ
jgi:Domain of unknown function (DUF4328)